MSTIVGDILDAIKSTATTAVPSLISLRHILDIEKNSMRELGEGFGVRPLSATNAEGITRAYTMDQGFELILTKTTGRGIDESDTEIAYKKLYERGHIIFKAMLLTKIGLPSKVLAVFPPSMDEPDIDQKRIVLRIQVVVKYRELIT